MALCLTVAKEKRQPQNDGYICIISDGSPQLGDEEVSILDVGVFKTYEEAEKWFEEAKITKPWENRH